MQKITFNRTIYVLLSFFSLLSYSTVTAQESIVFEEDFSSASAGDNTTPAGSGTVWTGNANFPAGGIVRAYQAGNAVRIGTGSLTGYITTVPLDLSANGGNFTVTLEVKGWTIVEGPLKVTLTTPSGTTEQMVTYTATMTNPFETKFLSFTGGMANSTLRFETTAKRAFLNYIRINQLICDDVTEPMVQAQAFCGGATVSDLQPSGTGITWYGTAGGETALNPTDALATGTYYVSNTVGACESDLVPVSISINAIPGAPETSPQTLCDGSTVANLAAAGTDLQWYTAATGGDALSPTDELAPSTYYVTQSVNGCESARTAVIVTINSVGAPDAVSVQSVCNGAIVEDLDAQGSNVLWYTSAEGGTALNPADAVADGTYYASQTVDGCESQRTSVTVTVTTVDVPQGAANQEFTPGETVTNLEITGLNVVWYSDEALTMPVDVSSPLTDGVTYYAVANNGNCMSAAFAVTANEQLFSDSVDLAVIKFYPNPVKDVLIFEHAEALTSITIYNVVGQKVLERQFNQAHAEIDMAPLPSGLYNITVLSGSATKNIKVIKQ